MLQLLEYLDGQLRKFGWTINMFDQDMMTQSNVKEILLYGVVNE